MWGIKGHGRERSAREKGGEREAEKRHSYLFFPVPRAQVVLFLIILVHFVSETLQSLLEAVQTLQLDAMVVGEPNDVVRPFVFTILTEVLAAVGDESDEQGEDKAEVSDAGAGGEEIVFD